MNDDERALNDYLLKGSLPSLIIKIIGTNNEQMRYSVRASIQNALKLVLRTLMENTSKHHMLIIRIFCSFLIDIWLLNGTRTMIDLAEDDKISDWNPYSITCEVTIIEKRI